MAGFFLWHDSESFEPNEINETCDGISEDSI